jgi:LacI family transcriptional regulator
VTNDESAPPARPVTIKDVAQAAGVSISTVSRALDRRHPSRSTKAARVREIAERLGYTPDLAAAQLRRGATQTVGVVVPRLRDTVMAMLFEEIAGACSERDLFAVVATTGDDPARQRTAAESLLARNVDGLILTTARTDDDYPAELRRRGVRHVLALREDGASPAAVGDDSLGGYLATRHLLDLGHRRVGLVSGPAYATSARGRLEGYRSALTEHGLEPEESLISPADFSIESGERAGHTLLTRADRPTAVFAINDNTAIGVLAAAHALGLRVPEDVSLVGYNDIPLVSRLPVPLTSVRVPLREIAVSAVDLLLRPPLTDDDRLRTHAPTLIPRASTTAPG